MMLCFRSPLAATLAAVFAAAVLTTAPPLRAAQASASTTPLRTVEGIDEYRLPNGLQVLLAPDDSKPTTTVNVTYHVGSRQENYGETGMAHLLEHLLFKGTPTTKNVWAEFTRRGLRANGSTWFDRTNYFASFNANEENLRWYLSWQADAMTHSFIAKKDLDSEMTVVRNEMESGENSPQSILYEKTIAAMFDWHNYAHDAIGARADVENVDIGRLQAFYRTYYQPDDATLIVSGKFDAAKVLAWVQADFGRIPKPTRVLPRLYTLDPVQEGERAVTLRRPGGTALLDAGYHVPPGPHPDTAAIELLGLAMTDAPGGRLHKALVDTQLAASVDDEESRLFDPGFVIFSAQLTSGADVKKAREAMVGTLESVADAPITPEETERARAKWLKNWDLQFSNPETVGVALSESISQGDWRLYFLLRDRVKTVNVDDVNRVAKAFLVTDNRTLGTFVPTDRPVRPPVPERVDVSAQLADFHPVTEIVRAEAFDATPANIDARTRRFEIAPGLKVALLPKGTRGDVVQAQLRLLLGDEASLRGEEQIGETFAEMLDKGTTTLSRQQIQDRMTALKAKIGVRGGGNSIDFSITSTRATLPDTIALVADMVRNPALPQAALDEVKRGAMAQLEEARTDPDALVGEAIARHGNPYPRGDLRYPRSLAEIGEDVGAVTVDQLRDFERRFVGIASAQFAAVGAMDVDAVRAALEQAFGGWASATPFQRVPRPLVAVPPARLVVETPDKQNATMQVALSLPIRELDPDRAALDVANFIVGGGGSSRLWHRIRDTEGLSYGVGSNVSWTPLDANSTWETQAIFAPQNGAKVEAAFKEEVDRSLRQGFTLDEVKQAKEALLNYRRLSRAQDARLAGALLQNEYLGRTLADSQKLDDAIAAVTPDQAIAAWRKYIDPSRLVIGVGGDFKGR